VDKLRGVFDRESELRGGCSNQRSVCRRIGLCGAGFDSDPKQRRHFFG